MQERTSRGITLLATVNAMWLNSTINFTALSQQAVTRGRMLANLMRDDEYPGLAYLIIFFAFLFALMWYLLGCFGRPVVAA